MCRATSAAPPRSTARKAFHDAGIVPAEPLSIAREPGATSLCFLCHPTLTAAHVGRAFGAASEVVGRGDAIADRRPVDRSLATWLSLDIFEALELPEPLEVELLPVEFIDTEFLEPIRRHVRVLWVQREWRHGAT